MRNVNTFAQAIQENQAAKPLVARTLNGMRARATTSNANLDLFGSIGGMRGQDVSSLFAAALEEDQDLAIRILQWTRDIRGGQGERKIFRDLLLYLEKTNPDLLLESELLLNVPEIGRFDDLLIFQTETVKSAAYSIFLSHLINWNSALAAKWAPRKGKIATELKNFLGLSWKQYRKLLVELTNVVETKMCDKNWNEINFSHVPSVAMSKYIEAFKRNAPENFQKYQDALSRNDGSAKANAGAVYPYNILHMLGGASDMSYAYSYRNPFKTENLPVAEEMWRNLPDYMNGKNVIAVCDNSGSMQQPLSGSNVTVLDVATSLTMYTASKSKGAFKDLSISFSADAKFCQHSGSLIDRIKQVCSMDWNNTNFESVLRLVLNHAKRHDVPQSDMPDTILIFSDMQFDHCANHDDSALQMIRRKFEDAGYEVPNIVFWNLAEYGNKPVKFNDAQVALVSGFSPSTMKSVLSSDSFTPESIMRDTVCISRYDW